jgi:hypothetical protein
MLVITKETPIINMKYYAKYNPGAGFKFVVDGLHNLNKKGIFITLVSLTGTNNLYSDTYDPLYLKFFSQIDWKSPLSSPKYDESYCLIREMEFNKSQCLIFDVREIVFTKEREILIKENSFTVFPIFDKTGYVNSGAFQVPLYDGAVKRHLLDELRNSSFPWRTLQDFAERRDYYTKKKLLNRVKYSSVVFRLLDGQREGHLSVPFDYRRMNYSYLPQDELFYYSYNEVVEEELQSKKKCEVLLETGPVDTNLTITSALIKAMKTKQFSNDNEL